MKKEQQKLGLEEVLAHQGLRPCFSRFLASEFSSENLEFYDEVGLYKVSECEEASKNVC